MSRALYSPCETYRYLLERDWQPAAGRIAFVMLNPSTASEQRNDPTVERCERRARRLGFGGFTVVNLFAFRATRPADLRRAEDPVGPENDAVLAQAIAAADLVLAAWGAHGAYRDAGARWAAAQRASGQAMHHIGLTKDGHPRHPLYVPYAVAPQLWF